MRRTTKLHSVRFKFLITIISAMLAISVLVGGLAVYEVDRYIRWKTEEFIHTACEKEAAEVNAVFGDMEKSVNIMYGYVMDFFDGSVDVTSRSVQNEVIEAADRMFADVAKHTDGTIAYYLRFALEIADGKTGFFFTRTNRSKDFARFALTDLTLYEKDDTEHVGWYWQPYEAGEPIWMRPYYNRNNGVTMISYVVPMYVEGQFIGVVGMDFDYTILIKQVHGIKIYDHGFAHLELDGSPIHIDKSADAYRSEDYMQVSQALTNGMTLVLSASYDDMRQIRNEIEIRILLSVLVLAAIFCAITVLMVRKMVNPLRLLTDAARKLADGDYDVEPVRSNTQEIHLLSTAFEHMSMQLREHEKMQQFLAYRDSLTGLRNTTSFKVWVTDFDKEIQTKNVEFGVIVLDLNYLKETNDHYGHDMGNKLIVSAAQLISDAFKRSPVFRIGGDEFLVILQNRDLEEREALCEKFDAECLNRKIETGKETLPVSIARGFAKYDPETDAQFLDVFNRADDAMYQHKRKMKSSQAFQPV